MKAGSVGPAAAFPKIFRKVFREILIKKRSRVGGPFRYAHFVHIFSQLNLLEGNRCSR